MRGAAGTELNPHIKLYHKADPHKRVNSATALLVAAEGGNTRAVAALVAAKADVDAKKYNNITHVYAAAERGYLPTLSLLVP